MKNMLLVHVSLQHGRVGVLVWARDTVLACVSHMVHATQKWAPNVKTVLTQHLSFHFYFCTFFLCSLASVTCCLWLLVVCLDKYRKQVSWKDIWSNLFCVYQKELWISHLGSLMFEPRQFLCCKLKPQWIILVALSAAHYIRYNMNLILLYKVTSSQKPKPKMRTLQVLCLVEVKKRKRSYL